MIVQVNGEILWHHCGVQPDPPRWQRSSRCSGGTCVEVATVGGTVLLRDGKNPDRPALEASAEEWAAFVTGIRDGEFDQM